MNIFVALMLVFAAIGLLDEILGGKLRLTPSAALAVFTGAMVSGGLGATVGYQLPVFQW